MEGKNPRQTLWRMRGLGQVFQVKLGEEGDVWGRDGHENQTDREEHLEAWD
jgi:hypothetical protein